MEPTDAAAPDVSQLLQEGHDLIGRTGEEHARRWGLGTADRWSLDQAEGTIRWHFPDRVVSADAQFLASWSPGEGSFVWAWDNASLHPDLCRTIQDVREYGERHDIAFLTKSPLALDAEQASDAIALAFRIGGCTGLYHPPSSAAILYIAFGEVVESAA